MSPERIQLRRTKGWRLPEGAVSVARPTRFGNPFAIGRELDFPFSDAFGPVVRDRAHAVEVFATYARITSGYELLVRQQLRGKTLACWCPLPAEGEPDVCHAAVLLELANGADDTRDRTYEIPDEHLVVVTDSKFGTGLDTWDW